ncbi:hypothetical protein ACQZ6S_19830 [Agrobacterium tumefaciens]|jgi:hypothetical protein
MDLIEKIWLFKFSLAPALTTYVVFELSTIIRKITRIAYTPIYFMFFPLGHADELYSQYFNEDSFYIGVSQTPEEKNKLRKRIISISVFSMIFSTVINPLMAGVFAAVFLNSEQFLHFFWFLAATKLILTSISLYNTRNISFVGSSSAFPWIALIYVVYFAAILRIVNGAYDWATSKIASLGISGMLLNALDLLIIDFGIYILIAGLLGAAISYWMTDPDNIPEMEIIEEPELLPVEE